MVVAYFFGPPCIPFQSVLVIGFIIRKKEYNLGLQQAYTDVTQPRTKTELA